MQNPIQLTLKVAGGDAIQGDSSIKEINKEDVTNTIECLGWSHELRQTMDANRGTATGRVVHAPIVFRKHVDKASPYLAKSIVENTELEGEFKFYQPNNSKAKLRHFYTIKVTGARVSDYKLVCMPGGIAEEEVALIYRVVTWVNEDPDNRGSYSDDWGKL